MKIEHEIFENTKVMKYLLLIMFVTLSSMNLFGQIESFDDIPVEILNKLDSMGLDRNPLLNKYESAYFNIFFEESRKGFDFIDKKIAFITGSNGKTLSNKEKYFILEKDRFNRNYSPNNGELYLLNPIQKKASGGYDAVIVYWCKVLIPMKNIIEILKR